ncbi:MAG: electron transfer flavoprotein subunit alpha/FixB family protein [Desulfobacterales bacterium]|nr:MAG: electron transfer flavoprotein subunit alpha/FixB family protein [Desulfobacterales bacterium]
MMDIWILVQQRHFGIEEVTFGLIAEARHIIADVGKFGRITAVAFGNGLSEELPKLGAYGADRVIYLQEEDVAGYHGELFARELVRLVRRDKPSYLLTAQSAEADDLAPRLAALLETALISRTVDFKIGKNSQPYAVRTVSNGYLFEEIQIECPAPVIISFLPSVLTPDDPNERVRAEIQIEPLAAQPSDLKTKLIEVTEADPETLSLEEADVIVAGGRGVGKGESFDIIYQLAKALGACVGGTRPVIDWQTLPFESQIGQTGKTVAPRLIVNCGVSGANEYTAGMENSHLVIAINKDPRARIFRFADLGIIGDVHEILPTLIKRIQDLKDSGQASSAIYV